jgi:hypothetical protein
LRRDSGPHLKTGSSRRDERRGREGDLEMYTDGFYMVEDRVLREQDLTERMARRAFTLALTAEREDRTRRPE